jgi:hypothetical protein
MTLLVIRLSWIKEMLIQNNRPINWHYISVRQLQTAKNVKRQVQDVLTSLNTHMIYWLTIAYVRYLSQRGSKCIYNNFVKYPLTSRSQGPRFIRHGSTAVNLLGLRVRITPGIWMSVSCECCVSVVCCQLAVSASGWSLFQRSPTECGVSECDREVSIMKRPWPTRSFCAMEIKKSTN